MAQIIIILIQRAVGATSLAADCPGQVLINQFFLLMVVLDMVSRASRRRDVLLGRLQRYRLAAMLSRVIGDRESLTLKIATRVRSEPLCPVPMRPRWRDGRSREAVRAPKAMQ